MSVGFLLRHGPADASGQPEVARMVNDAYGELIARHPGRFQGFASIPMDAPDAALAELHRAVGELKLQGVILLSNIRGRALSRTRPTARSSRKRTGCAAASFCIRCCRPIRSECSRPGAAAVALWATQRLLPLSRGGEFARGIEAGREAALALYGRLKRDERFVTAFVPELDILVWTLRAPSPGVSSDRARKVFAEAARRNLHLALADLPADFFGLEAAAADRGRMTCLRSVLMKPEHRDWAGRLWDILDQAAAGVLTASGEIGI